MPWNDLEALERALAEDGLTLDRLVLPPTLCMAFRPTKRRVLFRPEDVAEGVWAAYTSEETGEAWVVQPGREPLVYGFRGVPGPR